MRETRNYAAPGAHVGMQVDGDVVITGGLFIGTSGRGKNSSRSDSDQDDTPAGDSTDVQEGATNTASGNQVVGVQAGRIHGRRNR